MGSQIRKKLYEIMWPPIAQHNEKSVFKYPVASGWRSKLVLMKKPTKICTGLVVSLFSLSKIQRSLLYPVGNVSNDYRFSHSFFDVVFIYKVHVSKIDVNKLHHFYNLCVIDYWRPNL